MGFYISLLGMALAGAVLAWALPGQEALWSAIVLVIPLLGSAAGLQWMRNYVASPVVRLLVSRYKGNELLAPNEPRKKCRSGTYGLTVIAGPFPNAVVVKV